MSLRGLTESLALSRVYNRLVLSEIRGPQSGRFVSLPKFWDTEEEGWEDDSS